MQKSTIKKSFRELSPQPEEEPPYIESLVIDYRGKLFEMMKKNADQEIQIKKYQLTIQQLEDQLSLFQNQLAQLVEQINTNQRNGKNVRQCESINIEEENQYDKLICQYKSIITTQHKKLQAKTKKYLEKQKQQNLAISELQNQCLELRNTNQSLRTQLQIISTKIEQGKSTHDRICEEKQKISREYQLKINQLEQEVKEIMDDNNKLSQQKQRIENQYNKDIEHFQQMEKLVEEKLIEVEAEMNFYKEERKEDKQIICQLRKELEVKEQEKDFSFGEDKNEKGIQTEIEMQSECKDWSEGCYQESIKTLLEQNNRLKKTLLVLHKANPNQELPEEVKLELKLLVTTSYCQTLS